MLAKPIAGVLALSAVVLLALPVGVGARPRLQKRPASTRAQIPLLTSPEDFVFIQVGDRQAYLVALENGAEGNASVIYDRELGKGSIDRLDFGLGKAGEVDLHFVPKNREAEEVGPSPGCKGGPTLIEEGRFVGTISFHPPGGFVAIDRHSAAGSVIREPATVCPGPSRKQEAASKRVEDGIRRLVAGNPDGRLRVEATTYPSPAAGEPQSTSFSATEARKEGGLRIYDEASVTEPEPSALAVPDLASLPATATVEPPAPFSGSATFDLPSRTSASVSGDLAVELPEVGKVPLIGPGTAAGVCHGFACTRSLPKPLRPRLGGTLQISITTTDESSYEQTSSSEGTASR